MCIHVCIHVCITLLLRRRSRYSHAVFFRPESDINLYKHAETPMHTISATDLVQELSYSRLQDEGILPDLFPARNRKSISPTGFPRDVDAAQKLSIYRSSIRSAFWNVIPTTTVLNAVDGPYINVKRDVDFTAIDDMLLLNQKLVAVLCLPGMEDSVRIKLRISAASWNCVYSLYTEKKMLGEEYERVCMLLIIAKVIMEAKIDYINDLCIVSPLHGAYRIAMTSDMWDKAKFLEELGKAVSRLLYRQKIGALDAARRLLHLERVFIGCNVRKSSIVDTFRLMSTYGKPIQLFVSSRAGNRDKTITTTAQEIVACSEMVEMHNMQVFIHAPYIIRLASENDITHKLLKNDLEVGVKLGARGVVVHTASNTDGLPTADVETSMYRVVRNHLQWATEKCPILLETPAKEGKEIVTTVSDFIAFYKLFSEEERKRVKICVDTCHVFSAGYYPLDYMKALHEGLGDVIGLVHFNGSATPLNGKNDRHSWMWRSDCRLLVSEAAGHVDFDDMVQRSPMWMRHKLDPNGDHPLPKKPALENLIPLQDLLATAEWCRDHNIPTLVE